MEFFEMKNRIFEVKKLLDEFNYILIIIEENVQCNE